MNQASMTGPKNLSDDAGAFLLHHEQTDKE
jgi:hypothetical protein